MSGIRDLDGIRGETKGRISALAATLPLLLLDEVTAHLDRKRRYALFEEIAALKTQTSLMILCNPQNPSGKIWSREDLSRIGELCARYYVTVVSDEIHCDLTDPGKEYIPFASVSDVCRDISITCVAPTKTFNIAGLQTAAVIVPHKNLRHKVWRALNTDEVAEPNAFAVWAAEAAYNYGDKWHEAPLLPATFHSSDSHGTGLPECGHY